MSALAPGPAGSRGGAPGRGGRAGGGLGTVSVSAESALSSVQPVTAALGLTYLEFAVQSRLLLLLLTAHSLLASELRKIVLHFLKNASPVVFSALQPAAHLPPGHHHRPSGLA